MVHFGVMLDRNADSARAQIALKRSRVIALSARASPAKPPSHASLSLPSRSTTEGYAVEEVLKALRPDEAYYWATHNGAEIDLVLFKNGRRIGIECKRADAPILTPSMRIALADLKLDELQVVYPGERRYMLASKVEVVPLAQRITK